MSTRLLKKVAIVFGAGSSGTGWGNGKAVAVAFAREGARVVCVDRGLAAAEETAQIIAEEGNEAEALAADVTDYDAVARAVAAGEARFGRIDILHNNVGQPEAGQPLGPAQRPPRADSLHDSGRWDGRSRWNHGGRGRRRWR